MSEEEQRRGQSARPAADGPPDMPPLGQSLARILARLALIVVLVWIIKLTIDWVMVRSDELSGDPSAMLWIVILLLLAYGLLIAVPFVPGVEIGISLMMIEGPGVAPYVYLATVIGLAAAYLCGRYLPYDWLHQVFADLRMRRICALLSEIKPLSRERRLALMRGRLPRWASKIAVDGRYLGLALLFNLPGNSVIGGGGGIALMAGISRLFTLRGAVLTIALAVAPVPLAVWYFGIDLLGVT